MHKFVFTVVPSLMRKAENPRHLPSWLQRSFTPVKELNLRPSCAMFLLCTSSFPGYLRFRGLLLTSAWLPFPNIFPTFAPRDQPTEVCRILF